MDCGDGFNRLEAKLKARMDSPDFDDSFFLTFHLAKTNKERMYVLLQSPIVRPLLTLPTDFPGTKSYNVEDSQRWREQGNKHFKEKKFQEALTAYNDSILCCRRESGTKDHLFEPLALSYANRSAVWYHLLEFECCITDIDAAITAGYPAGSLHKLYERQVRCLLRLHNYRAAALTVETAEKYLSVADLSEDEKENALKVLRQHAAACVATSTTSGASTSGNAKLTSCSATTTIFKLLGDANQDFPALSSAVGVARNYRFGTHIVAQRDIDAGEVLAVEEPLVAAPVPSCVSTHCYGCLKRLKTFYPCRRCSVARYCSQQCERSSWSSYHRYECRNMAALTNCGNVEGHVALRATLIAGLTHDTQHTVTIDSRDTAVRPDVSGCSRCPLSYSWVLGLSYQEEGCEIDHIFWTSVLAVYLALCVDLTEAEEPMLTRSMVNPDGLLCDIAAVTFHHLTVFSKKLHGIIELRYIDNVSNNSKSAPIADAVYPTVRLFNHSCDANVSRHYHGSAMVVRSLRPILKGEQVFDDYGALYLLQTKSERNALLKKKFRFDCSCDACQGNWPTMPELGARAVIEPLPACRHPESWIRGSSQCRSCKEQLSAISREAMRYSTMVRDGTANGQDVIGELTACLNRLCSLATRPHYVLADCTESLKHCYDRMGNTYRVSDLGLVC